MNTLDVFMFNEHVGQVRRLGDGQLVFGYTQNWLENTQAIPIAPQFPLHGVEFSGPQVSAYFDNLLHEGNARDFISRALHMSAGNVFGVLSHFGADTAGALVVLPEGKTLSEAARYLPVSTEDIRSWLTYTHGVPLNIPDENDGGDEEQTASLSGAQDKMSVFVDPNGNMALPIGSAPSSHILKPSMPERKSTPELAVNEVFVMQLARAAGLDVPYVEFLPELSAALVQRYDRVRAPDGSLERLHQNDLCQILGYSKNQKYEAEGGPTFKQCLQAVSSLSTQPDKDTRRMIEWMFFNLAVGNMDSHAKNVSLITSKNGETQLAPFYDLVCTTVYPYLGKKFAFKIGGENRPGWIRQRHWQRFADDVGFDVGVLHDVARGVCDRISGVLPSVFGMVHEQIPHMEGKAILGRVEEEVRRGVGRIKVSLLGNPRNMTLESAPTTQLKASQSIAQESFFVRSYGAPAPLVHMLLSKEQYKAASEAAASNDQGAAKDIIDAFKQAASAHYAALTTDRRGYFDRFWKSQFCVPFANLPHELQDVCLSLERAHESILKAVHEGVVASDKHAEKCKAYQEGANTIFRGINNSIGNAVFPGYMFDAHDVSKQDTKPSPPPTPKQGYTPPTFKP